MASAPTAVVRGTPAPDVLTEEALQLVATLQRTYGHARNLLLQRRSDHLAALRKGTAAPGLDPATAWIRDGDWTVPPAPPHLADRRCEITGPADRKMMISALNSGARVFLCDLEDALSPSWANVVDGHRNIRDAALGTLTFTREDGSVDTVGADPATIVVRPRGLHLDEPRVLVDGAPVSAGLFDIAVAASLAGQAFADRGTPLALYLPKIETWHEAAWWDALIGQAEWRAGLDACSIRVTVLIETLGGAMAMDEILHALRDRVTGLNAGRWDYLFSIVKQQGHASLLPDRASLTMTVPFMAAYAARLVAVCHRRGAHAIGGMSAFVPIRGDDAWTEQSVALTTADKEREAALGYDGTWVAHPALVPAATAVFDAAFGDGHDQLHVGAPVPVDVSDLLDFAVPGAEITPAGVSGNVEAALDYVTAWLGGRGAVALHGRMEDVATAEIARCQLWQWIALGAVDSDGAEVTAARVIGLVDAMVADRKDPLAVTAATLLRQGCLGPYPPQFLTTAALDLLDG